jgi:hypothetical protein
MAILAEDSHGPSGIIRTMPHGGTDLYHRGTNTHFNVMYGNGVLDTHVLPRHFTEERRASDIEWVWIVEADRRATPEEIRQLCSGTWKATQ